MRQSLERVQQNENNIINSFNDESSLQKRMEKLLTTAQEQYDEYIKNGEKRLWQKQNEGIIEYVVAARKMMKEDGGSQIIQAGLEAKEIDTKHLDDARLLAFCRILETNKQFEN